MNAKRILSLLLTSCMMLTLMSFPVMASSSGTCGDNLTWTLDDYGTLTISGTGAMRNYLNYDYAPWYNNRSSVKKLVIEQGVTTIGGYAFEDCGSLTSVTIPDSVTTIGTSAFDNCSSLTSVTIPDSVTTIGNYAFYDCDSLASVTIGNSVTTIGARAFDDCYNLKSVFITDIAKWCEISFGDSDANPLHYAENLYLNGELVTDLVIPNGVTTISDCLFYGCTSFASVTIPDSVTTIGSSAFYNCSNIKSVYITDIAKWCEISFDSSSANPLYYAANLYLNGELVTDLVIPDGLTTIGYAFNNCTSLTSVTIPDSVTTIGDSAFSRCTSLTSVTIPDSVTTIGNYAFYNCTALTEINFNATAMSDLSSDNYVFYNAGTKGDGITVNIGANVTKIPAYLFSPYSSYSSSYSPKITTVEFAKNSVCESIGARAFYNCTFLKSVTIPESVSTIGKWAFYSCSNLKSVYITDIAKWCEISFGDSDANPLYYAENLYLNGELVTDLVIPNGVTTIGEYAFRSCTSFTSVTIPDSVTTIGSFAFDNCSSLTSVTIGDSVTKIGNYAFSDCTFLTSVTIPDSVTKIGDGAFSECSSLASVTIPNSVTTIGSFAFDSCLSLTSVTIPDSVTTIGNSAFYGCSKLTSITIPDSVTTIGSYAFYDCTSLTSVTIGDSVTKIGEYAFYGCSKLKTVYYNGTKAQKNAISIGSYNTPLTSATWHYFDAVCDTTCSDCGYVREVDCHTYDNACDTTCNVCGDTRATTHKYDNACDTDCNVCGATRTEAHRYSNNCDTSCNDCGETRIAPHYYTDDCDTNCNICGTPRTVSHSYTDAYDATCNLCGHERAAVPEGLVYSISNGKVTITDYTGSATELIIPETIEGYPVTAIGYSAFRSCTSLTSVTIPDSVTTIGYYAFDYCDSLTSITIGNSVTTIGGYAFNNCFNLKSVYITDIAKWCEISFGSSSANPLNYAKNLYLNGELVTDLVIPNGVTTIGNRAFYNCNSLTSVTIPDSVTTIGSYAFYYCSSLASITISDSVTSIGNNAFRYCSSLTSVTIPDSVTTIGSEAFFGCDSLASITISDSVTSIGNNAFSWCSKLTSITVDADNQYYSSQDGVLFNKNKTTLIQYPAGKTAITYTIPDSVTTIGKDAFYPCRSLKSVTIGNSVTTIGERAFGNCTALKDAYYNGTNEQKDAISIGSNNTPLTSATWHYVLCEQNGHTYDYSCDTTCNVCGDTRATTHKYDNACDTSCNVCGATRTVPDHVYSNDCDTDCNICSSTRTVPDHVYDDANDAFCNICDHERVALTAGVVYSISGSEVMIMGYTGSATEVVILDEIDGYPVTMIAYQAFYNSDSIVSIRIPTTITIVGMSAFDGCTSLKTVYYNATKADRENISIFDGNDALLNAKWQYLPCEGDHTYDNDTDAECNECGFEREVVTRLPGDVNGDGTVNNKDFGILRQHLNNWEVTINESNADVNADGIVNNKDMGILRQYLNGWDVTLK